MRTFVIAVGLFAPVALHAAVIDFQIIEARWDNVQGATLTFQEPDAGNFGDPARIRWGTPTLGDNNELFGSGYNFTARTTPFTALEGDVFDLGSFTHQNQPIDLPSITSADLLLRTSFGLDTGEQFDDIVFEFTFNHDETVNDLDPCPYDETDGLPISNPPASDINANGCADLVSVTSSPDNFEPNGLTLSIDGFAASVANAEAGEFESAFVSGEASNNNAVLAASFRFDEMTVNSPATLALLGFGLIGLAGGRLARKTHGSGTAPTRYFVGMALGGDADGKRGNGGSG